MRGKSEVGIQWLILSGIMAMVLLILMFSFSVQSSQNAKNAYNEKMQNVADAYTVPFREQLEQISNAGTVVAKILARDGGFDDSALVHSALAGLRDGTKTYYVVACERDGTGVDADGNPVDIRFDGYLEESVSTSEISFHYVKDDGVSGKPAIMVTIPVSMPDRTAYLLCFYSVTEIESIFDQIDEYNGDIIYMIMDTEGTIIACRGEESNFYNTSSFWENVDEGTRGVQARMRVKIQNHGKGAACLTANGETRTFFHAATGINEWSLLIGMNQDSVEKRYAAEWKDIRSMLTSLIVVIIIFIGSVIGISILLKYRNTERSRELQEKADMDLLTGLNNKLATERKIKEYMASSKGEMAVVFVLDIDNFKKINDTMGHAFGDEVLRGLGKQISSIFRISDVIGRTGGDEFTILLKNVKNEENARTEAAKLTRFFLEFTVGEYVKYSATASIGAAIYPTDGADFEEIYKSADTALYKAKKRGKNQIAFLID